MVLRSGGDFALRDVQLIARHINGKWQGNPRPRIICLWDKATSHYDIDGFEVMPLKSNAIGTWSRIALYSPEMEQYRPFLYVDLDTAVINSLEKLIDIIPDESKFITLEDFWQKGQLATGLVWFPAKSEKISKIYNSFNSVRGNRMDKFIRTVTTADLYWQQLTNTIYDFKARRDNFLASIPEDANLICFHGKPRIFNATGFDWVRKYIEQTTFNRRKVTVIIPYKADRGWLQDAINSIPKEVQLILSQGEGLWPQNFNKALPQAEGDYIRWLHDDDMLTENCIEDSVNAIESQNVDFIHGNAIEIYTHKNDRKDWIPKITHPSLRDLINKNVLHSATMMYKKEVFDTVGILNETSSVTSFEEYEYNLRCMRAGMKLGYCSKTLAYYRRHPNQLIKTTNKRERMTNRRELLSKFRA